MLATACFVVIVGGGCAAPAAWPGAWDEGLDGDANPAAVGRPVALDPRAPFGAPAAFGTNAAFAPPAAFGPPVANPPDAGITAADPSVAGPKGPFSSSAALG